MDGWRARAATGIVSFRNHNAEGGLDCASSWARLGKGCSAVACRPANRTRCGLRRLAGRGALQRLARARRRRRANGAQKLGDSCSGTGDARRRSRWRAFSVGERYPAPYGFPRWFPMHGGAIFWPATCVNNSDRLAETYTEPYTVGPLEGWNSQENQVVTINRKALKSPRGIRRNTMFPPALRGWKHPAPPVPRPRTCPPPHPSRSRRAPTAPLKLSCLKPYTSGVSTGRAGVAEWQTQRT